MHIPREVKKTISDAYNKMAHELYKDPDINLNIPTLRLAILQVITEKTLSREREALTTARRLTKTKLTRKVNDELRKNGYNLEAQAYRW